MSTIILIHITIMINFKNIDNNITHDNNNGDITNKNNNINDNNDTNKSNNNDNTNSSSSSSSREGHGDHLWRKQHEKLQNHLTICERRQTYQHLDLMNEIHPNHIQIPSLTDGYCQYSCSDMSSTRQPPE